MIILIHSLLYYLHPNKLTILILFKYISTFESSYNVIFLINYLSRSYRILKKDQNFYTILGTFSYR